MVNMIKRLKTTSFKIVSLLAIAFLVFGGLSAWLVGHSKATTNGQTYLFFKKEPSDVNATYNSLTLSPGDTRADTASATTSTTNVNVAGGPTALCESSNNTGETFTQISASAASTGERCIGTFISPPVGSVFTMSTTDTPSISANVYTAESASQVTSSPNIYIYQCSSTCTSPGTLIAKWTTCADPGTSPTVCTAAQTAVAPANNITFAATDRIVIILSQNITRARTGNSVSNYIDSSSRSPSAGIQIGYNIVTPNTPSFTGAMDDDFNFGVTQTTCANTSYHTKWTCPTPSAANSSADFISADTLGNVSPSSTGWLNLRNQCSSCTVSNFGTTPSNAFIYQTLPGDYGDGNVRTIVNSALSYQIGATSPSSPYNHVGLVLWTSNTNYLEIQLYSTGVKSSTNTVQVALNNSGSLSGATNINTSTTAGTYGRIWLGFSNTGGSYQAQYSTDGSSWTSVGSAVAHDAFLRTGLNSFAAISGANYSGAFDWFQSTLGAATYTQDAYRWNANLNQATPPGTARAASNTVYTTLAANEQVRLRLAIAITGQSNATNSPPSFKLQYVDKGSGTCASPSGGTPASYTDVTASTLVAFYNNTTPADGANISTSAGNDPTGTGTNVAQTYEELNNFSANQNNLNNGNDGLWDFSLVDNGASAGATYCFQVITSGGSALASYTNYPTLTIYTTGPTMDQVMRGGNWFNSSGAEQGFFWAQ